MATEGTSQVPRRPGGLDSGKPWRSLVAVTRKEDPMAVKPVPEGYHTVTPFLTLKDAAGAIEFYKKAFGAQERVRMPTPDGKVAHAELQIGDSRSEEHTSELQSPMYLVCRLLL